MTLNYFRNIRLCLRLNYFRYGVWFGNRIPIFFFLFSLVLFHLIRFTVNEYYSAYPNKQMHYRYTVSYMGGLHLVGLYA